MSQIPYSWKRIGLHTDVYVVAIDPKSDRCGLAEVDLKNVSSSDMIRVTITPQTPEWALNVAKREITVANAERQSLLQEAAERYPQGVIGTIAPDISEGTWLNTEARSLKDFRGKYVLLDFWFIGCGPCYREMPTLKLLQEKFSDRNFSVVSVHNGRQNADAVRKFADENGMTYPIVVDAPDEPIIKRYSKAGVYLYPSYILLDPEGKIILNDIFASDGFSLRDQKVELVYRAILEHANTRKKTP